MMETEYVYPRLADRSTIEEWQEKGSNENDARIRQQFDIRLRPENMTPKS